MKTTIPLSLLLLSLIVCPIMRAEDETKGLSPKTKGAVKSAIDKGVRFLRQSANKDGHWGNVGVTALVVNAFFNCPRKYGPEDGPWIRRPLDNILAQQKEDGGIYERHLSNYTTSVAIMALSAHPQVAKENKQAIERARDFIVKLQCDEGEGYTPDEDIFYGGIGYGGDERPDLSNTQFAIEALREAGLPADHPALKKALVFLQRCQNNSEVNDQAWSGNDGGFVYYPGNSPAGTEMLAEGKTGYRSYGSMTYAGIKSYIYADVKKDDPRVRSAYEWIQKNYDLSQNPGAGQQGLFYYYHTFAKTLKLWGDPIFVDSDGKEHNWREDVAKVLIHTQREDGSWVNENSRWWEADPRLVTAYSVLTLSLCYE